MLLATVSIGELINTALLTCLMGVVLIVGYRVVAVGKRVERLLTMTERHGASTDQRAAEMAVNTRTVTDAIAPLATVIPAVVAATAEVVERVAEVPKAVVKEIREDQASTSGQLPTVAVPG